MNTRNITFSKETYDKLKKLAETGKGWNRTEDFLGNITQGAVCADLILIEDEEAGEEYTIAGDYALDAHYYYLNKDGKYDQIKNVPYDEDGGFYFSLKDTYEETIESLSRLFEENIEEEYKNYLDETDLTWEKVEAYEGDVYPGFEAA